MIGYRVISSDDHVFEPADLWTSRIEPKYRDRAPRLFHREEDNTDWWTCEGIKGASGGSGGKHWVLDKEDGSEDGSEDESEDEEDTWAWGAQPAAGHQPDCRAGRPHRPRSRSTRSRRCSASGLA